MILGPNGQPVYQNAQGIPATLSASYPPPPNFDDGIPPAFEHLGSDPVAGGQENAGKREEEVDSADL